MGNMTTEISVPEAAKQLGVSTQRVYKMIETGVLRGRRMEVAGRAIIFVDTESVRERIRDRDPFRVRSE